MVAPTRRRGGPRDLSTVLAREGTDGTIIVVANRLFDEPALALLQEPRRWSLVSTLFPPDREVVADRQHQRWRLRSTHAHAHREVLFALEGDVPYGHPIGIVRCAPGSCLYFEALEPHDDHYPETSAPMRHLWFGISRGWVQLFGFRRLKGQPRTSLISAGLDAADLGFEPGAALDRVREISREHPALGRLDLLAVLQAIVARLIEDGWRDEAARGPRQQQAIEAVRRHIHDTAGVGVSLGGLSRLTGYSRFHLLRLFREITGMSIGEWIDRCRLERARRLRRERKTLAEAAPELGFSSPSALSRWGRRHGLRWSQ
jgi:AraC-like DNA-binding protein